MDRIRMYPWVGSMVLLVLVLALALPVQAGPSTSNPAGVEARAASWLARVTPDATATFIVSLRDDGTQAQADQARAIGDRLARRAQVHQTLSARASRNDRALRAFLKAQGLDRDVGAVEAFMTFNGFSITASKRAIEALRGWDQVSSIELEEIVQLERPQPGQPDAGITATEWNITKIGADRAQTELGINGSGVVVGGMDTGVRYTHTALNANYKCAGTSHTNCWLDAISGQAAPYDDNGHGTHTMGTAVGSGGIGVAPGAKWIACKAFNSAGSGFQTDILECFDWFLAPGGSSANAPDVVTNSWGNTNGSDTSYQEAVTNWVNAGIYPEFSNGNNGPSCSTVGAPASYTNAVGTGATDINDVIANFSSRGPSPFGVIKPDLSAPGVNIRSAWSTSDTAYNTISGTSMAGPHTSGLVALLLDANSDLTIDQLTANMKANALGIAATACSSSGVPNNVYGWGRIRAFESVQAAVGSGTSGTLSGTVTNAATGAAISSATVTATGPTTLSVQTNTSGQYSMSLPGGTYSVTASKTGFTSQTVTGVVVSSGATTTRNFALSPSTTTGTLTGIVTNAATGARLSGATVTATTGSTTYSDQTSSTGRYSISLPAGIYSVTASKTGFTSQTVTGVVVSSGATTTLNFALSPSPSGSGTLTGTVRSMSTGATLANATVKATIGSTIYSATTNSSGVYSMSLPAGTYSVTAKATGYILSDPVNVTVSSGTTTTEDFRLEKIPTCPPECQ